MIRQIDSKNRPPVTFHGCASIERVTSFASHGVLAPRRVFFLTVIIHVLNIVVSPRFVTRLAKRNR